MEEVQAEFFNDVILLSPLMDIVEDWMVIPQLKVNTGLWMIMIRHSMNYPMKILRLCRWFSMFWSQQELVAWRSDQGDVNFWHCFETVHWIMKWKKKIIIIFSWYLKKMIVEENLENKHLQRIWQISAYSYKTKRWIDFQTYDDFRLSEKRLKRKIMFRN